MTGAAYDGERVTARLAQEAVREAGLCGSVDEWSEAICIMYVNHPGDCGWVDRRKRLNA